ncbi:Transcription antitermination factor NusG [Gracilimonas mengyeensis]|uniref:Transcription antitermination factor NusG n=2 Tax=Gracilimonas mengyeensis TaxID=1302730 RepID=A0A521FKW4_9BACT|nr:Transcription antitermination factor NusG [Gracilimonas mengyeensis]
MAIYTRARAEKKVHDRLEDRGFEVYLPLKKSKRQWSDRVKVVAVPVISSYVFVCCTEKERFQVLQDDAVVNFVFYRGKPAVIRDEDMNRMWKFLADYSHMDLKVSNFKAGQKVTVQAGPLQGRDGEVMYTKDSRVGIRLESLGLQISAEVEGVMLGEH